MNISDNQLLAIFLILIVGIFSTVAYLDYKKHEQTMQLYSKYLSPAQCIKDLR